MRILNYAVGYDTGGQGIRIKQGCDRYSEHEYRQVARRISYIQYPVDADPSQAQALGDWADVVHVSHRIPPFRRRDRLVDRIGEGKPLVVHHHGTAFRRDHAVRLAEARRARATLVVSTVDLLDYAPEGIWLPAPYDLEWLATFRNHRDDGVFRVGHTPTARGIKSTEKLVEAVHRLASDLPVELVLGERVPWTKAITLKGVCDVYFDQVILGYGNNAIEAWGMGIPVVAGAAPDTLARMADMFGTIPFYRADDSVDSIYTALRELAEPEARAYWGKVGAEHAHRFHREQVVVGLLEQVYTETLSRF